MLKTSDYKDQILELYYKGLDANNIAKQLGFKYHQPVYNFLKKHKLNLNKRVYTSKYSVNKKYFDKIDSSDKAYILGFICADGYVADNRIKIALASKDVEILEKIKYYMKSEHPITKYIADNPYKKSSRMRLNMVALDICGITLAKKLRSFGLTADKTYTLNSSILKHVPKFLHRDFLRGYFDGDGHVTFGSKYSSGTKYNVHICGNENFLLGTYQKCFPTKNKLSKDKLSKQCFGWRVSSKENVMKFLEYLYHNSDIRLQRKYKQYLKAKWSCKTGLIAGNS